MRVARRHREQNGGGPKLALKPCRSLEDVFAALDGDNGVMALTKSRQNNVFNWRNAQRKFPAKFYLIMTRALAKRGYTAPPSLWGIAEPS
jgi:hypothetical protein